MGKLPIGSYLSLTFFSLSVAARTFFPSSPPAKTVLLSQEVKKKTSGKPVNPRTYLPHHPKTKYHLARYTVQAKALDRPVYYRVVAGDTLWAIAKRNKISVRALRVANHLSSDLIMVGQQLTLPIHIKVKPGESLTTYAQRYKVSLAVLWQINHLHTDHLHVGQTLVIPYQGHKHDRSQAPDVVAASTPPKPKSTVIEQSSVQTRIAMLAHLIHAEAGNQPFLGQVAVGAVVLNRLENPSFPKTLRGVIFEPGAFESVGNGTYYGRPNSENYRAAKAALSGWDPTNGALYFYNPSLMTGSSFIETLPVTARIGEQVFCQ